MNILLSNTQGFVGSNFVKSWKVNHSLYGLNSKQISNADVRELFTWDKLDEVPNVDAIIHLAGMSHDSKSKYPVETYFNINTELTKIIFDYFLQSKTETFVFFSSVKAAADNVPGDILIEDVVPNPVGPYGESKLRAEEYILTKCEELRVTSNESAVGCLQKRVYILRPCLIHGPKNKGNLTLLYNLIKKGIPWPLGVFDNRRSFCSIDNILWVVEQLILRTDLASGIYHVGDDEPLSTNELINLINESLGRKSRIWKLPKSLINSVAILGSVLHLPLNTYRLKKLTENYVVSNDKLKKALDIERMPVSAREGMRKTFESFR